MQNLTSVTIPGSVIEVGSRAFQDCSNLNSVTMLEGVRRIGSVAFEGCTKLTDITIPESVTDINGDSFEDTPWLEEQDVVVVNGILIRYRNMGAEVRFPDSVTSLAPYLFRGYGDLTSVVIPPSVTAEGTIFWQCNNLTSITLPLSAEKNIAKECRENLSFFYIDDAYVLKQYAGNGGDVVIPDVVTAIGRGTFAKRQDVTSVTIPDAVTSIEDSAFENCSNLSNVIIPDSVTSIGEAAFSGTPWLDRQGEWAIINQILLEYRGNETSVVIPEGVTRINSGVFADCINLTEVTIPKTVTSIGSNVFQRCGNLNEIHYEGTKREWKKVQIESQASSLNSNWTDKVTTEMDVIVLVIAAVAAVGAAAVVLKGKKKKKPGLCTCGHQNAPGAKFCEKCGNRLQ